MPQATLTFTLPEDKSDLVSALQATAMKCAIGEWLQAVRAKLKYTELKEGESEVWECAREMLRDCLDEWNVTLEDT
jgi:hypothetical protein